MGRLGLCLPEPLGTLETTWSPLFRVFMLDIGFSNLLRASQKWLPSFGKGHLARRLQVNLLDTMGGTPYKGGPPTPSPKKLSILDAKNEPIKKLPCTRLSEPLSSLAVMKLITKCQTVERFRIFHILHPRLNEASEAKRIGTETKRGSRGLQTI